MTAAYLHAREGVGYNPLLNKSYQHTRLGRSVVDFLAWMELGGAADRTLDQYERDLARACLMYPEHDLPFDADRQPTAPPHFGDSEMTHVARSFKPKERRVRVAAYKSYFKWARLSRRVIEKPTDALPTIKRQPKKVYDLFTAGEVALLCGLPVRDGALMQILFDSGARRGDCLTLRLRDYLPDATADAPYGMLVFREGKGGKDRQVQASELVARKLSELATLEGLGPNDFLWYTRPGGGTLIARDKPMGKGSFDRWWRRCLNDAGVRYRNPHLTRHTFATNFLRGRGRLETLKRILGHESIATTEDLYGHLDMRDVAYDLGLLEKVPE